MLVTCGGKVFIQYIKNTAPQDQVERLIPTYCGSNRLDNLM